MCVVIMVVPMVSMGVLGMAAVRVGVAAGFLGVLMAVVVSTVAVAVVPKHKEIDGIDGDAHQGEDEHHCMRRTMSPALL